MKSSSMCEHWKDGLCVVLSKEHEGWVGCPHARASNAGRSCCHHPVEVMKQRILTMHEAGVKMSRYKKRLTDPLFVGKLYAAFERTTKRKG